MPRIAYAYTHLLRSSALELSVVDGAREVELGESLQTTTVRVGVQVHWVYASVRVRASE
jgi:hypothetical protein